MVLISDFIKELEKIKSQYGDILVVKCTGKGCYQESRYFSAAKLPHHSKMVYRYDTEYELTYGHPSSSKEESVCVIHFS